MHCKESMRNTKVGEQRTLICKSSEYKVDEVLPTALWQQVFNDLPFKIYLIDPFYQNYLDEGYLIANYCQNLSQKKHLFLIYSECSYDYNFVIYNTVLQKYYHSLFKGYMALCLLIIILESMI